MRGMSTAGHSKGVIKSNPVPPLQYGYNQIYKTLTSKCSHKIMCKWQHSQIRGQILRHILVHEFMPLKPPSYLQFNNKYYHEIVSCKVVTNDTLQIIK